MLTTAWIDPFVIFCIDRSSGPAIHTYVGWTAGYAMAYLAYPVDPPLVRIGGVWIQQSDRDIAASVLSTVAKLKTLC